jgi:hypothetical protein
MENLMKNLIFVIVVMTIMDLIVNTKSALIIALIKENAKMMEYVYAIRVLGDLIAEKVKIK